MSAEAEYWKEYKATGSDIALEALAEQYQNLVYKLAHKIRAKLPQDADLEELIADGMYGLVKAIEGFDPDKGFRFTTYAVTVIRGSIYNGMRRMDWLPERTRRKMRNLKKAIDKLHQIQGRPPSEEDIAEELEISTNEVYDLIANLGTMYMISLDQPLGTESEQGTIGDLVEDGGADLPENQYRLIEEQELLRETLTQLDERERLLIESYYFEGIALEAVASHLGVSKQRVSQLHARALRKMRKYMGNDEISREALTNFTV